MAPTGLLKIGAYAALNRFELGQQIRLGTGKRFCLGNGNGGRRGSHSITKQSVMLE